MADDSTSFEIDVDVNAASAPAAASAVQKLAEKLEAAGLASAKAAEAVKVGEAAYRQAEATANKAASALEKVSLAADAQAGKLKKLTDAGDTAGAERAAAKLNELKNRQAELVDKANLAKAAMNSEAQSLDKLKGSAEQAVNAEKSLNEAQEKAKKNLENVKKAEAAAAGSGKVNEMAEAFGKLGGPLGQAGQKALGAADGVKKLLGSLGTGAGPYVAITVAVVAIGTAAIAATAALLTFALSNSDAARTSGLLAAGIAGSVAGGAELDAKIASLTRKLPQTSDELRSMAAELAKTGLKGDALSDALEASAEKAAKAKLGPEFQKGMLSSEKQSQLLKMNLAGIFALKSDALAGGIGKIIAMFDETSVTGAAIKAVFESLFQPLVDGLAGLAPKVVSTFIQFEIWVMRVLILMKSYGPQILAVGKVVLTVGAVIAIAFGAVIAVLLAFMAISVAVGIAIWSVALKLGELIVQGEQFAAAFIAGPGGAFEWLTAKVTEVVAWLSGLSLFEVGANIVRGLATGITSSAGAVVDSVKGIAGNVLDSAVSFLKIGSPSKLMRDEVGVHVGTGIAGGIDDSAADVQASIQSAVSPPDVPTIGGSGGGKGGGGNTFTIIVQAASGAAEDIAAAVRAELEDLLDGDIVMLGGAVST